MAYDFTRNDGGVNATELVYSIFSDIDASFYDVLYPELVWRDFIPAASINTNVNPGAMSHVYQARDKKGMGQFIRGNPNNIPMVGQSVQAITVPICDAAVGAIVTNAEARRHAMGFNANLAQDLGEVMKLAGDKHHERGIFFGDALAGFEPYIDYNGITIVPLEAWTGTDSLDWVMGLNDTITSVFVTTKNVHKPDTLEMAPTLLGKLVRPFTFGSEGALSGYTSGLDYLKKNNYFTLTTGQELKIVALRYLEGAGVEGANRIILKESNPRNFLLCVPMAYQLVPPQPDGLSVKLFAEYSFSSFHVRYQGAMTYIDVALAEESS